MKKGELIVISLFPQCLRNMYYIPVDIKGAVCQLYLSSEFCTICILGTIQRKCMCTCSITQSCPILHHPINCSLPGLSVLEIFQARTLEWVAISYSRGSFRPRDQMGVPCISFIGRRILYHCATLAIFVLWAIVCTQHSYIYILRKG